MRDIFMRPTHWLGTAALVAVIAISPINSQVTSSQEVVRGNFFQGAAREQAFAEVERLREIQRRYVNRILSQPGAHGMGITLDRETGRLVFKVTVEPEASEPDFPDAIEGVPLHVRRQGRPKISNGGGTPNSPSHADELPLPVQMGNSGTSDFANFSGTLGFKACDVATSTIVYVTNAHLSVSPFSSCAGSAGAGWSTVHPSPPDDVNGLPSFIGSTAKERPPVCPVPSPPGLPGYPNWVDAASVNSEADDTQFSIRDIGAPGAYPGNVLPGDWVQKSGRSTGYTSGVVLSTNHTEIVLEPALYCNCLGGSVTFVDQLEIIGAAAGVPIGFGVFSDLGDSGSAVLDGYFEAAVPPSVVGLVWGHDKTGLLFNYSYANPIDAVLAALDLSLNPLDCSEPCAATFAAQSTSSSDPMIPLRGALDFRDYNLAHSERGRDYIRLYYRFTKDIVSLMLTHPMLSLQTTRLFDQTLPVIDAMAKGRVATVTPGQIAAVDRLFARYAEVSSDPALQRAFTRLRRDLHDPEVLNEFRVRVAQ